MLGVGVTVFDREPTRISYLALPISAILFGLFLIWTVLEKESALYDEQHHLAPAAATPAPARRHERSRPANVTSPILSARMH